MHSLYPAFSHIYFEAEALQYPLAKTICAFFPRARLIEIDNYRQLFNQPRQEWRTQKESQKLILAVKHGNRIHAATHVLPQHSETPLYYTTPVINCLYDCQYCFLQAMYRSANMVTFVNEEDFYHDALATSEQRGKIALSVSYDCDLLGSERFIPWTARWLEFARLHPQIEVEIRTKSNNYSLIKGVKPHQQAILSWSLAPESIWKRYEHRTASPTTRIEAAAQAARDGWRVRLCFDPVLPFTDWRKHYQELLELVALTIPSSAIEDVSVGVFRMGEDHLRNLRARNPGLDLLQTPMRSKDGIAALENDTHGPISESMKELLGRHFSAQQIVIW